MLGDGIVLLKRYIAGDIIVSRLDRAPLTAVLK
jgi:hypothetical protein